MKRSHVLLLAAVLILGGAWFSFNTYVASTGDPALSGQDQTAREVPKNENLSAQPEALPDNSKR
jgi:hypothetical protein